MKVIRRIARDEWTSITRDKVAMLGLLLLTLLSLTAGLTAWQHRQQENSERLRHQLRADHEFEAQPDRHPHRMVHYGHFVFRPLNALAGFDSGIDPYIGHTLFLEGHRQNGANFGDVRQSSLLMRFGQITPAFVLQVLAPLLLVFVGHGALARERESGTLRMLLTQGVTPLQILLGKLLALGGLGALALLPATIGLAGLVGWAGAPAVPAAILWLGHAGWMLLWTMLVAVGSTFASRRRDALLGLLAVWAVTVILVPRVASDIAATTLALPTRFETDIAVARDLAAMGDSHDPDDPYFSNFRKEVLAKYGVSRVEDLPVNYKGLLGMEGERLTSELFDRYSEAAFAMQARQSLWMDAFGVLSPAIAVRRLSMAAAGTDLENYRRFLEQAERHRYRLIQALNALQAEKLSYQDDRDPTKENRVDRGQWHDLAEFTYEPAPSSSLLQRAGPAAACLLLWLLALAATLMAARRHLGGRA